MYNETRQTQLTMLLSPDRGGISTSFDQPPLIESAEITRVDDVLWVVDGVTKVTGRTCLNMEVPGFGVGRIGGMGGYMPQVGDKALICFPSDEMYPKILNFLPYIDPATGFRGLNKKMKPGDYMMATADGNYVHVASGGIVDIASNPITRRMYIPVLNQIKDYCESYFQNTAGGVLRWENRRDDVGEDGAGTERVLQVKRASNGNVLYTRRQGDVDTPNDPENTVITDQVILNEVLVNDAGEEQYRVSIDLAGNILAVSAGSYEEQLEGEYLLSAKEGLTFTQTGDKDPAPGSIRIKDGVQLAEAKEPAVLGDSLLSILEDYDSKIQDFLNDLNTASIGMASAAPATLNAPSGPNAMGPVAAKYAGDVISAVSKAASGLSIVVSQFKDFLAQHTKLS